MSRIRDPWRPGSPPRVCRRCRREFLPRPRSEAQYCSEACREAVRMERRTPPDTESHGMPIPYRVGDPPRVCTECGTEFTPSLLSRARCCSRSCTDARRNRRVREAAQRTRKSKPEQPDDRICSASGCRLPTTAEHPICHLHLPRFDRPPRVHRWLGRSRITADMAWSGYCGASAGLTELR